MEKVLILILFVFLLIGAMAYNSARVKTKEKDSYDAWVDFPSNGIYALIFYRQSGNFHKKLFVVNGNRSSVEEEIKKVFSRAKIETNYMVSRKGDSIVYERAYPAYSPLGKRYSKGIGSCHVFPIKIEGQMEIPKKTIIAKSIQFNIIDTQTGQTLTKTL